MKNKVADLMGHREPFSALLFDGAPHVDDPFDFRMTAHQSTVKSLRINLANRQVEFACNSAKVKSSFNSQLLTQSDGTFSIHDGPFCQGRKSRGLALLAHSQESPCLSQ